MSDFIIKGFLIGIIFGIPVGAMGAMTAQRTLSYGMKAGLLTGLGSSAADSFYACIGVFGLTFISDFLLKYQGVVNLAGGCLILYMGIRLLQNGKSEIRDAFDPTGKIKLFVSSFAVGITNPSAILTFLFAFSWFGVAEKSNLIKGTGLVCGVFAGTCLWWGILIGTVTVLRKKAKSTHSEIMNRLFGTALILFGTMVLVRNFLD